MLAFLCWPGDHRAAAPRRGVVRRGAGRRVPPGRPPGRARAAPHGCRRPRGSSTRCGGTTRPPSRARRCRCWSRGCGRSWVPARWRVPTVATGSRLAARRRRRLGARAAWSTDAARALADGRAPRAVVLAEAATGLLDGVGDAAGDGALARLRRAALRSRRRGAPDPGPGAEPRRPGRRGRRRAPTRCTPREPDDAEALEALLRSEASAGGGAGRPGALRGLPARPGRAARGRPRPGAAAGCTASCWRPTSRSAAACGTTPTSCSAARPTWPELRALVRTGRLTTILGPGGLGKTRIAHVLAREATQPRVHFVELVGISAGDDVVSEVGAALGVRDSVTGRRTLTPAQLADVRGRIAQELDTVPTLLVLDNCEHVLDAVASLVAFLLVTTRDLRVRHHQPGAARDRRRAGLPAQPARGRATARSCSAAGPGPSGPTPTCPTTSSPTSWPGSTACRSPWSWRRRGSARCRSTRYAARLDDRFAPAARPRPVAPRRGTRP